MTVVGATTAVVATTAYVPPFRVVTSYPPTVSVTGTITKPISNNPTVAPGTNNSDYAWAYLQSHMMSWPSYRYIYILWIVLALLAGLYTLGHHLRLSTSRPFSPLARWSMRRRAWGRRTGPKGSGARSRALPSNGVLALILLLVALTVALSLVGADYISPLSSVLNMHTSFKRHLRRAWISGSTTASLAKRQLLFPGQTSISSPGYTIQKSLWTLGSRFGDVAFALLPLCVLLALKSAPFAILSLRALVALHADKLATLHKATGWGVWAATTAHVALWTVQLFQDARDGRRTWFAMWTNYRFVSGVAAYAALTAVMVASLRVVRKRGYEFFYAAHVVLVLVTLAACALHHPVLWFWIAAAAGLWVLERLWRVGRMWRINGFSSSRRLSLHAAGALPLPLPRDMHARAHAYADVPQGEADAYAMSDLTAPGAGGRHRDPRRGGRAVSSGYGYEDKDLPLPPRRGGAGGGDWTPDSSPGSSVVELPNESGYVSVAHPRSSLGAGGGARPAGPYGHTSGYGSDIFQPLHPTDFGASDGARRVSNPYADPYDAPHAHAHLESSHSSRTLNEKLHSRDSSTLGLGLPSHAGMGAGKASEADTISGPVPIPKGYALAQLLPSRTIRLTVRVPRPFSWAPGQAVLLYLPELSRFQSHPFSIVNAPPSSSACIPGSAGADEVVLLVKARKGLTRALYESVRASSLSAVERASSAAEPGSRGQTETDAAPVYVRTRLDGPFGSAARVRWTRYATVVLVCGGSGVSFGMGVLESVVGLMQAGKGVRRVRFVWVAREYAEIAWVAYALRRLASVPHIDLQIEIYITNAQPRSPTAGKRPLILGTNRHAGGGYEESPDALAPPRAAFAGGAGSRLRRDSSDSLASVLSTSSDLSVDVDPYSYSYPHAQAQAGHSGSEAEMDTEAEHEHVGGYADAIDLTNYEDEEDVLDPAEGELSARMKGEGKVRRAKSRRVARRARGEGAVGMDGKYDGAPRARVPSGLARESMSVSKSMSGMAENDLPAPRPQRGSTIRPVSNANLYGEADEPSRLSTPSPGPGVQYGGHGHGHGHGQGPFDDPLRPPSHPYAYPTSHSQSSLAPPRADWDKRASYRSNLSGISGSSSIPMGMGYDPSTPVPLFRTDSPSSSVYFDRDGTGTAAGAGGYGYGGGRESYAPSIADSSRGFGPSAAGAARYSRTGSMVLLDTPGEEVPAGRGVHGHGGAGVWLDKADYDAMKIVSEFARPGRPGLGRMVAEEAERAEGRVIVATCGPVALNAAVRAVVSVQRRGRGVELYSEDYD